LLTLARAKLRVVRQAVSSSHESFRAGVSEYNVSFRTFPRETSRYFVRRTR